MVDLSLSKLIPNPSTRPIDLFQMPLYRHPSSLQPNASRRLIPKMASIHTFRSRANKQSRSSTLPLVLQAPVTPFHLPFHDKIPSPPSLVLASTPSYLLVSMPLKPRFSQVSWTLKPVSTLEDIMEARNPSRTSNKRQKPKVLEIRPISDITVSPS